MSLSKRKNHEYGVIRRHLHSSIEIKTTRNAKNAIHNHINHIKSSLVTAKRAIEKALAKPPGMTLVIKVLTTSKLVDWLGNRKENELVDWLEIRKRNRKVDWLGKKSNW